VSKSVQKYRISIKTVNMKMDKNIKMSSGGPPADDDRGCYDPV